MQLDNRTLLISSVVLTAVTSVLDIFIWRTRNTFPGFGRWALAHVLFAPAMLLLSLRSLLPDWLTIGVANTLVTLMIVLLLESVRQFRGLRPQTWQAYAGGACSIGAILFFRYGVDDLRLRVVVATVAVGLYFFSPR